MTTYLIVLAIALAFAASADATRSRLVQPETDPGRVAAGRPHESQFSPRAFAVGLVLASVAGLRWQVGTDYWTYESLFPRYVEEARAGLHFLEEPGMRALAWLVARGGGEAWIMLLIASLFTVGLSVRTIWRWSPSFALGIAIYVLSGGWHASFNAVRQCLAAAILFAGHRYAVDRRPIPWLIVVASAFLFHVSAVVGVLLYFVPRKRLSALKQLALFGVAIGGSYATSSMLGLLATSTSRGYDSGGYAAVIVNPLRVAFAFLPVVIVWLFSDREYLNRHNAWFYINMLLVNAAVMLASSGSALLARFAIYTQIFVCIGVAFALFSQKPRQRLLVSFVTLTLFLIFWVVEVMGIANLREFKWIFSRG